jgi:hypothetical protein
MRNQTTKKTPFNRGDEELMMAMRSIWLGRWYDLRTFDEDIECDPQEIRALFNNVLDKGTYETYN